MYKMLWIIFVFGMGLAGCGAGTTGDGHPSQQERSYGSNWGEMKWDKGEWE